MDNPDTEKGNIDSQMVSLKNLIGFDNKAMEAVSMKETMLAVFKVCPADEGKVHLVPHGLVMCDESGQPRVDTSSKHKSVDLDHFEGEHPKKVSMRKYLRSMRPDSDASSTGEGQASTPESSNMGFKSPGSVMSDYDSLNDYASMETPGSVKDISIQPWTPPNFGGLMSPGTPYSSMSGSVGTPSGGTMSDQPPSVSSVEAEDCLDLSLPPKKDYTRRNSMESSRYRLHSPKYAGGGAAIGVERIKDDITQHGVGEKAALKRLAGSYRSEKGYDPERMQRFLNADGQCHIPQRLPALLPIHGVDQHRSIAAHRHREGTHIPLPDDERNVIQQRNAKVNRGGISCHPRYREVSGIVVTTHSDHRADLPPPPRDFPSSRYQPSVMELSILSSQDERLISQNSQRSFRDEENAGVVESIPGHDSGGTVFNPTIKNFPTSVSSRDAIRKSVSSCETPLKLQYNEFKSKQGTLVNDPSNRNPSSHVSMPPVPPRYHSPSANVSNLPTDTPVQTQAPVHELPQQIHIDSAGEQPLHNNNGNSLLIEDISDACEARDIEQMISIKQEPIDPGLAEREEAEKTERPMCQVCGDIAAGFHCGAYVCEACKKFFVRCVKSENLKFTCPRTMSCEITRETRTRCQYCRYIKCISLGMYKPGGTNVSSQIGHMPCSVCGAPSSGFHFGAITCEGCKGFFRRTVKERDMAKYECSRQGSCVITTATRNICKYCRYKKCLDVGMKPDGSRIGRQPNAVKHATMLQLQEIKMAKGIAVEFNDVKPSLPKNDSVTSPSSTETSSQGPFSAPQNSPVTPAISATSAYHGAPANVATSNHNATMASSSHTNSGWPKAPPVRRNSSVMSSDSIQSDSHGISGDSCEPPRKIQAQMSRENSGMLMPLRPADPFTGATCESHVDSQMNSHMDSHVPNSRPVSLEPRASESFNVTHHLNKNSPTQFGSHSNSHLAASSKAVSSHNQSAFSNGLPMPVHSGAPVADMSFPGKSHDTIQARPVPRRHSYSDTKFMDTRRPDLNLRGLPQMPEMRFPGYDSMPRPPHSAGPLGMRAPFPSPFAVPRMPVSGHRLPPPHPLLPYEPRFQTHGQPSQVPPPHLFTRDIPQSLQHTERLSSVDRELLVRSEQSPVSSQNNALDTQQHYHRHYSFPSTSLESSTLPSRRASESMDIPLAVSQRSHAQATTTADPIVMSPPSQQPQPFIEPHNQPSREPYTPIQVDNHIPRSVQVVPKLVAPPPPPPNEVNSGSPTSPDMPSIKETIERVQEAYRDLMPILRRCPDIPADFMHYTMRELWEIQMAQFKQCAFATVKFSKNIPGFKTIPIQEQIARVQECMYPIVMTVLASKYDLDSGQYCYFNYTQQEEALILEHYNWFGELITTFHVIGFPVQYLHLDNTELSFLCALKLFSGCQKPEFENLLIRALEEYCRDKEGDTENRVGQVLLRLSDLARINEIHHKTVMKGADEIKRRGLEIPQLFQESFLNE